MINLDVLSQSAINEFIVLLRYLKITPAVDPDGYVIQGLVDKLRQALAFFDKKKPPKRMKIDVYNSNLCKLFHKIGLFSINQVDPSSLDIAEMDRHIKELEKCPALRTEEKNRTSRNTQEERQSRQPPSENPSERSLAVRELSLSTN